MTVKWLSGISFVACVCVGMADSVAAATLPDAASYDWVGMLETSDLPDESVLFEYSAKTFSASTQGAWMAVSFVPRFDCNLAISLRIPTVSKDADALLLEIDGELFTFDSIREKDGFYTIYSLITTDKQIEQILEKINGSFRVNVLPIDKRDAALYTATDGVQVLDNALKDGNGSEFFGFSLLGSKLSTEATRFHCVYHKPAGLISK